MSARAAPGVIRRNPGRPLIVAGVMSGTSADGVDVAFCRISAGSEGPRLQLLSHTHTAYPSELREAVLRSMDAPSIAVAELARLSWRLGQFYAACVERASDAAEQRPELIGCHGQTLYHQTTPLAYLTEKVRCTWQSGEAAEIAERMRCPVVSDFRSADLAAGGQGAPLVPMLDWLLFRSRRAHRVLQNLGGIANLTAMPAGAGSDAVVAFDSGPANMVIDGCMRRLFDRDFDAEGEIARQGLAVEPVLESLLQLPYFAAPPPKSCGREQFGDGFTEQLIRECRQHGASDADVVRTATELTVRSVLDACERLVLPLLEGNAVEYFASGGGVRNALLLDLLRGGLERRTVTVRLIDDLGFPAEAKEAAAFALLAWLTLHRLPGNVVSGTGARRPVVLGKICFG